MSTTGAVLAPATHAAGESMAPAESGMHVVESGRERLCLSQQSGCHRC